MLVGRFRASYAHVFEPSTPPGGGEAKYQITMLIPKSDVNTYNAIVAEMNRALQEGLQKTFGGQMPARPSMPLYDGDGTKQNGEPWGEECRGHWVLRASSRTRPSVVDINIQPILDPNAFYSGCYARATVNFYPYNTMVTAEWDADLTTCRKLPTGNPCPAGRQQKKTSAGPMRMQVPRQPRTGTASRHIRLWGIPNLHSKCSHTSSQQWADILPQWRLGIQHRSRGPCRSTSRRLTR